MSVEDTRHALKCATEAWTQVCNDYGQLLINTERCLQASFYHHLRGLLKADSSTGYSILIEATVRHPAAGANIKRIAVDTVVLKGDEILIAIELKFTPRGFPTKLDFRKDLISLSRIANRQEKSQQVSIEFLRNGAFKGGTGNGRPLSISPASVKLIAFFCSADQLGGYPEDKKKRAKKLWEDNRPTSEHLKEGDVASRWMDGKLPPKLGFLVASADSVSNGLISTAIPSFLGKPFELL